MDGVYFLFVPDFSKFFNLDIWVVAANQVIFCLSLGVGGNILFSKYREKHSSIINSALLVPIATMIFGILCAFINFCFLGNLSKETNLSIENLPVEGSDLAFVTYPGALSLLPFSNLWSVLFFFMLVTLGIDTQVRN